MWRFHEYYVFGHVFGQGMVYYSMIVHIPPAKIQIVP